jgi:heptosyltransferase-2
LIRNPKILIIQTAYLGDVILTLPVVQNIKKQLPEAEIDFMCIPQTEDILKNNPYIRNLVVYDKRGGSKFKKLKEIISCVRKSEYDIVISPHRSFRSAMITHFSGAKTRIGFNRNSMSNMLTNRVVYINNTHEIHRNLELVKPIPGITLTDDNRKLRPELFPSKEDDEIVNKLINTGSVNRISLAPCSKWFTKQLTKIKSLDIINSLTDKGFEVILIGGKDDAPYCMEVGKEAKNEKVLNLCGKLTPLQSKAAIEKSICLISVDSAAAHIGASTDTPIVQIYGSTIPAFGFYPLTSKNVIIENKTISCRPCTDHGRNICPLKHFKCMEELNTAEIIKSVENLIKIN